MEESILNSIKKDLGLTPDYIAFDSDVLMFVNGVFSTLYQLGVESAKNKQVDDSETTWEEFFDGDTDLISLIHPYTYLKVRMLFDPPTNSFVLDNMNKQASEYEWRINIQAEGAFDVKDS